ncbi:hypothetical protein OA332_02305 [Candidatus Pelagibacter sp.]|nr:hypothetical protein [Candidatus Pelagibacter sp.]
MNKDNLYNIIDFGMSTIRFSVFDSYLNEKFSEINFVSYDKEYKNHLDKIDLIIKKAEKKNSTHINDIILIMDTSEVFTIDISLKKNLDEKSEIKKVYDNIVLELNQIIASNYNNYSIIHSIISKCHIDNEIFQEIPNNKIIEKNIKIEFKVICFPRELIEKIEKNFIKKNLKIINLFCATYIKTLSYLKKLDLDKVSFLEIGWQRTSLISYENKKMKFMETIPIGSNHITKDISKVFNVSIDYAEKLKKLFNTSETEFSYRSVTNNDTLLTKDLINKNISIDKLKKVILYRVQEIIDLVYKNLTNKATRYDLSKFDLFLIGGGSILFNNNSFYLNDKFEFKSLSFFPETDTQNCKYALVYHLNNAEISKKNTKKQGLFEKFFNYFGK